MNFIRICFEKINLYIYVAFPFVVTVIYMIIRSELNWDFISIPTFQKYSFELVLSFFGVLLTLLGLFAALPNTKFKKLLKFYNHMKIINRTLAIGIFSALIFLILYLFESNSLLQEIMFIFAITETLIATRRIYSVTKFSLLAEEVLLKDP